MNSPIAPDIQQSLINTVYLLFSHNYIAFAYFLGLVISIILSLYKPSRFTTLSLLGFAILLFSFEYDKHIIDPLRNQTLKSLATSQPHYKLERLVNLTISEILPIVFYLTGWILIYTAIVYGAIKRKRNTD